MPIPVETVIAQWKGFDLDQLRTNIEKDLIEQLNNQQQSLLADRKHLVELTKDFKLLGEEEKLEKFKDLLKEYQIVIDTCTRKFSEVETSVKESFKPLLVLTNPAHLIEDVLVQISIIKEIPSNFFKDSKTKLEDQDSLQKEIKQLKRSLESMTTELARTENENASLKETNFGLEEQLAESNVLKSDLEEAKELVLKLQNEVKMLEKSKDEELGELTGELNAGRSKFKQQLNQIETLQNEMKILSATIEQERMNNLGMERECSQLKIALESQTSLEALKRKHEQEMHDLEAKSNLRIQELQNEINFYKDQITQLESKWTSVQDYAAIKEELLQLKQQHFNLDADMATLPLSNLNEQAIKKLEAELVALRLQLQSLQSQNEALEIEVGSERQRSSELESAVNNYEKLIQSSSLEDSAILDDSSPTATQTSFKHDDVITVLSNQRDRLKKRNQELENEIERIKSSMDLINNDGNRIKCENAKLYERLRYLENYATFKGNVHASKDPELGEVHKKYSPIYEDKHDPFNQFNQSEFVRKFRELGRIDQAFYKIGRIFFTNRMWRKISLAYFIFLHVALMYLMKTPSAPPLNTESPK